MASSRFGFNSNDCREPDRMRYPSGTVFGPIPGGLSRRSPFPEHGKQLVNEQKDFFNHKAFTLASDPFAPSLQPCGGLSCKFVLTFTETSIFWMRGMAKAGRADACAPSGIRGPRRGGFSTMPVYKAPVNDTLFVLNDVLAIQNYGNLPGFADLGPDTLEAIV